MKARFFLLFFLLCVPVWADTLTVYTYDSLVGKGSWGEWLAETFKKQTTHSVRFISFPSAGEALNQLVLDGKESRADVVLGIDNSLMARAGALNRFDSLPKTSFENVSSDLTNSGELRFLPFDFGFLSFVYDSSRVKGLPETMTLAGFASLPSIKKQIVIEDPRTSSLGLGFLVWTHALFPGKQENTTFWKNFAPKILTIAPGWSGAYSLFVQGEADFVLSYSTSVAYHIAKENRHSIHSIRFEEGQYRQVEYAGLVNTSKHKTLALEFLNWLLSENAQKELPSRQWIYPARKNTPLPPSFLTLPLPKALPLPSLVTTDGHARTLWLREWAAAMAGAE